MKASSQVIPNIESDTNSFYISEKYQRSLPWLLRLNYFFLALWTLSNTPYTAQLRGLRVGNQYYYLEILLLIAFIPLILSNRKGRVPWMVYVWGGWIFGLAVVGLLEGHNASLIYDRTRNWATMIILLSLLFHYEISSDELMRLLVPVFVCTPIGYLLVVAYTPEVGTLVRVDLVGFNFMFAAYAVGHYRQFGRFEWWYPVALATAFVVPVYSSARAKFLAMILALLVPTLFALRHRLLQGISMMIFLVALVSVILLTISPSELTSTKGFLYGGLAPEALLSTSEARFRERVALRDQMSDLDYLIGKGAGATWDGRELYLEMIGYERQNFHIYYFELFYWYGLIGLVMWLIVGVFPVVSGLRRFSQLNAVGVMGLISMIGLLLAWFGHAGYTMNEGAYIATSLYALRVGLAT